MKAHTLKSTCSVKCVGNIMIMMLLAGTIWYQYGLRAQTDLVFLGPVAVVEPILLLPVLGV